METKIIKLSFLLIIFFVSTTHGNEFIIGGFISHADDHFILRLPYIVGDNIEYIFEEDTPYAIDIIEILADGQMLAFVFDPMSVSSFSRSYFRISKTTEDTREYYISMYWYVEYLSNISRDAFQWNDGRSIYFINGVPATNTYEIRRGMEFLEITYRIMLPYPTLTIQNLRDPNYENKIFTEEYRMIVDIRHIFERSNR